MKFFLHDSTHIRIVNDTAGWQEWQGTLAEFLALEPEYPGLPAEPAGLVLRWQTEERQYLQDAAGVQYPDAVNALGYCDTIGTYPAWSPPDDSLIKDAITAADSTWSSAKIAFEIASGGGGAGLPVGVALIWFAASAPAGWYLADGSNVDESLPIGVWALSIGMVSNGNGTVPLPDMRMCVPMMAGTGFGLLSAGGNASQTLGIINMPQHGRHGVSGSTGALTSGSFRFLRGNPVDTELELIGGGLPFSILQPYFVVNFIIYGGA